MIHSTVNPSIEPMARMNWLSKCARPLKPCAEIVNTLSGPIFMAIGAAFCALKYADKLLGLIQWNQIPFNMLINPITLGVGSFLLGGFLFGRLVSKIKAENAMKGAQLASQQNNLAQVQKSLDDLREHQALEKADLQAKINQLESSKTGFIESLKTFPKVKIQGKDESYDIFNLQIGKGDIKTVQLGHSVRHGFLAVSVLVEGEGDGSKERFDKYSMPGDVAKAWQECEGIQNDQSSSSGGLGSIIEVVNTSSLSDYSSKKRIQYLVQPWYNKGCLWDHLDVLENRHRVKIGLDLLRGMAMLHSKGIVHGDVKPDNIMLNETDGALSGYIIDTDLTHFCGDAKYHQDAGNRLKRQNTGAAGYWAPELFFEEDISKVDRLKAEVWAVGVVMAMLFVKDPQIVSKVFEFVNQYNKNELRTKLKQDYGCKTAKQTYKKFDKWLGWDKALMLDPQFSKLKNELLVKMLAPDPLNRITLQEAYVIMTKFESSLT